MQVANALNNHIRILFNPKVEAFKLFDFLIVKSDIDRYLAQITEIYEDKFDASQNVAKLKLFYKITQNNEVVPYDNFTPNKECEIIKINQEEIENFINQDKETFHFATNAKDSSPLNMQYEFFEKNALILADKIDNANTISLNLAKNLSAKKPVILIDSTGVIEFEGAKKIKAGKTFKMPLNYLTIDYIFKNCLKDSSLEFQAIGTEIINEIKKFARSQEGSFIPFNAFVKVLLQQYKVTPYPELRLLLARIKKLQMDEIFARTKKDNETLAKAIQKNSITIIDLSNIEIVWQKAFLEYIVSAIEGGAYLIARINEENIDTDLIGKIYNEKTNISFIPNVSYNYKKLPSIIQYCKNYILMPSLYQRSDFLDANFALCNLIAQGCIIFGQNTDNFLYIASSLEAKFEGKKVNYRKINLTPKTKGQDEQKKPQTINKIEDGQIEDSQRIINELADFEEEQLKKIEPEPIEENMDEPVEELKDEPEKKPDTEPQEQESQDIFEPLSEVEQEEDEIEFIDEEKQPEFSLNNSSDFENILLNEEHLDIIEETPKEEKRPKINTLDIELVEFGQENSSKQVEPLKQEPPKAKGESEKEKISKRIKEALQKEGIENKPAQKQEDEPLSDEELDFFQIAKESSLVQEKEQVVIDNVEYKVQSETKDTAQPKKASKKVKEAIEAAKEKEEDNDIDLQKMASQSVDNNFEEIINKEAGAKQQLQTVETQEEKEPLPVYVEQQEEKETPDFKIGDKIIHPKYGKGTVVKTLEYEQRKLLQIEFETSGKKLLDPKVAQIQPE